MNSIMKCFIDTNVFIYAFDAKEGSKRLVARQLLAGMKNDLTTEFVISYQVMQEFCNVALKKSVEPDMIKSVATGLLEPLAQSAQDILSAEFYGRAVELHTGHAISFYDACIVQAALDMGCDRLYTEDLQDGQRFGKLIIKNPFAEIV